MTITKSMKTAIITGISLLTLTLPFSGSVYAEEQNNLKQGQNQNNSPSSQSSMSSESASSTSSNKTYDGLNSAQQKQHLSNIQTRGAEEINRRITTLNQLLTRVSDASHLTASDKAALTNEIQNEITGLTNLKTTLASETALSSAKTLAQDIYSDYRVYSLIVPQVRMVIYADDQQTNEAKLSTLAGKLQTRISSASLSVTDTTTVNNDLSDMNSKISAAQSLSSNVERSVINITPAQYDANHQILSTYHQDLQTAHSDNIAAHNDGKNIITILTGTNISDKSNQ